MPVKTVLFDFDGTLADTLPVSFKAFKEVFAKFDGRTLSEDEIVAMFGPTEDEILERHLMNRSAVSDAIELYYEIYQQRHSDLVPDHPEMTELLVDLHRRGVKIGVVTGKSNRSFQLSADALRLKDFFDVSITGDDVEKPKPDPEGVLKALDLLGVSKEEAVFVGDSNADVKAGTAAGVRTFAVQWLSVSQSSKYETEPDGIFHRIAEFKEWLAKEND